MEPTKAQERDLNLQNANNSISQIDNTDYKKENGIYLPPSVEENKVVPVRFELKVKGFSSDQAK